jgi:diguanylate cyclase (GGDEF)-like protein/PAS domain S-box-containing protein
MKGLRRGGGAPPDEPGQMADIAKRRLQPREAYRRLADHLSDAIVRYDAEKRPVYSNAASRRYLPPEAAPGVAAPFTLLSRQDARAFARRLDRVLKSGRSARLDVQLPARAGDGGERVDLSISLHPATDAAGRVDGVFAVARDVSALRRAAEAAEMKAHELQSLFDLTPDVVICYDRDLRRTYCNPAAERLLPTPLRALGKRTEEGTTLPQPSEYARRLKGCLDNGATEEFEVSWLAAGGDVRYAHILMTPEFDASGVASGVLAVGRDLTDLVAARKKAEFLSEHDPLTGLPNRQRFALELDRAIAAGATTGDGFALLYLDIDDFKQINDSFGHHLGDRLLQAVARRLTECVGDAEAVSRPGGDEFALLLREGGELETVREATARIIARFGAPFDLGGRETSVTVSIGVARCPHDDFTASGLMNCADAAMYAAKRSGKNKVELYSSEITARMVERMRIAAALHSALERNEFELHYQPKFDMTNRRAVGAEALARWNSRELGPTPPGKFIGVAEETGQIAAIGRWIVEEAIGAAAAWNRDRATPIPVAVNLSNRQFENPRMFDDFMAALERRGCEPAWVEAEITESLLVDQFPHVPEILERLHAAGVRIAIDDFGTGFSALSYLNRFPIDVLKIDRSFVRDLQTSRRDRELVKAIVSVAAALEMEIVAEGVETQEQAEILLDFGCRFAQGYLYSEPLGRRVFEQRFLGGARKVAAA